MYGVSPIPGKMAKKDLEFCHCKSPAGGGGISNTTTTVEYSPCAFVKS